jgi:glutamate-1-semialdehyde aminotransferase
MRNYRDTLHADKKKAVAFGYELIRRGVYCTPGGKLYLSLAHTEGDLDRTIQIAADAVGALAEP